MSKTLSIETFSGSKFWAGYPLYLWLGRAPGVSATLVLSSQWREGSREFMGTLPTASQVMLKNMQQGYYKGLGVTLKHLPSPHFSAPRQFISAVSRIIILRLEHTAHTPDPAAPIKYFPLAEPVLVSSLLDTCSAHSERAAHRRTDRTEREQSKRG